ncbi:aminodeoxychorismate synthase component I [Henriciella barbarensis]|uniref:aminodeoxychorismate synthase n=1 Tax=Henriciella barbarensis TaxID=86342 RepID=A0A399QY30_9PROT|nr:aminodeoxychorismate synthase component I [Henriciella barbarensis]RIJ24046.1 aminodeoxychorismate synthase component I [Henriciella barbarensis]
MTNSSQLDRLLTRTQLGWREPLEAFEVLKDTPFALLLNGGGGRWSYICANPMRTLEVKAADGPGDLVEARAAMADLPFERPGDAPPFCGGWAGLLSYEYGRALLPKLGTKPARGRWPDIALGLYNELIAFDHESRRAEHFYWGWQDAKTEQLLSLYSAPRKNLSVKGPLTSITTARMLRKDYEARLGRTVDYVHAGDCFQSNISQRFDFELNADRHPFNLTRRLAASSRAPFSAYFRLPGLALASNSPERFLQIVVEPGGGLKAVTQPIKGTRPRGKTDEEDRALANELLSSEKDLAENLMIVDLMRNDLSRISTPGSVRVPKLQALETYANVHHLVSTIEATLAPGRDAFDVIKAAFPGGSVTGAPKIRAMQIIEELEEEARGPYCGSLAWISPDGAMDSSILIRTVAFEEEEDGGWRGHFRSGGGIVADSVPAEEYTETLDKARAIRAALEGE